MEDMLTGTLLAFSVWREGPKAEDADSLNDHSAKERAKKKPQKLGSQTPPKLSELALFSSHHEVIL